VQGQLVAKRALLIAAAGARKLCIDTPLDWTETKNEVNQDGKKNCKSLYLLRF
jgi:hypothetical protein